MIWKQVYKIISIADIHFGVLDPKYMYDTLTNQFTNNISNLDFDILCICGDLFDSKFMSNNPNITYAIRFIDDLVMLCCKKNATIILLSGTQSHDNGQLSLFYHYLNNYTNVRIVENIQFEDVNGLRILCIPEKYGLDESEYTKYLYYSGRYDICILHGTYKNSFKNTEISTLSTNKAPVFCMNNFINCAGPILMGHYHKAGCYEEYAYYNGSALRFRFGEEEPKGFLITLYNPYDRTHYTELVPIDSYLYNTINIDNIINEDPKKIIEYIKDIKEKNKIDFIRVQFNNSNENMNVVRNYFRTIGNVKLQELDNKERQVKQIEQEIVEQNQKYSYIIDPKIGDYDKFVMYINQNEGFEFITTDELIKLLESTI